MKDRLEAQEYSKSHIHGQNKVSANYDFKYYSNKFIFYSFANFGLLFIVPDSLRNTLIEALGVNNVGFLTVFPDFYFPFIINAKMDYVHCL